MIKDVTLNCQADSRFLQASAGRHTPTVVTVTSQSKEMLGIFGNRVAPSDTEARAGDIEDHGMIRAFFKADRLLTNIV